MGEKITRREIEDKITGVGDYVKIDFLSRYLKKSLDFDTRKFVLINLAKLYENRKMYNESAKMMKNAADINTTFQNKATDYLKSSELFVRAGNFIEAQELMRKAISCAGNEIEKRNMKMTVKEFYKTQAKSYIDKGKRSNALNVYELLIENFELNNEEKARVQGALLELYEKLGKIREYYVLKQKIKK